MLRGLIHAPRIFLRCSVKHREKRVFDFEFLIIYARLTNTRKTVIVWNEMKKSEKKGMNHFSRILVTYISIGRWFFESYETRINSTRLDPNYHWQWKIMEGWISYFFIYFAISTKRLHNTIYQRFFSRTVCLVAFLCTYVIFSMTIHSLLISRHCLVCNK